MDREIFTIDSIPGTTQEIENQFIVADAFSGHCNAMPCEVRDETCIKVKGKWTYQYRALVRHGKPLDFMLSERRDEAAARAFFIHAIETNGLPEKVVIGKSGSDLAGLNTINCCLLLCGWCWLIDILRVKYLINVIEQPSRGLQANPCQVTDHRFIKKLTRPMKGIKSFHSASSTLQGIEVTHITRKQQSGTSGQSGFQQFAALAG